MKNVQLRLFLLLLMAPLFFVSCTKESLDHLSTTREIITQGTWSIDYYFEGQDKTAQFHGYQFNFNGNGHFTVTRETSTYSGTWSTLRNTDYSEKLTIHFETSNAELTVLENEWNVGAMSLNSVAMKNAANTQLRFHKQ